MNHTQGLWKAIEINYYIYNVCMDGPHRYAQVAECRGVDRAANAHLIAAAPELYEALKEVLELLYQFVPVPIDINQNNRVKNALNALAKAESK